MLNISFASALSIYRTQLGLLGEIPDSPMAALEDFINNQFSDQGKFGEIHKANVAGVDGVVVHWTNPTDQSEEDLYLEALPGGYVISVADSVPGTLWPQAQPVLERVIQGIRVNGPLPTIIPTPTQLPTIVPTATSEQ